MSDVYLVIALFATFSAVAVGASALNISMAERRRSLQLLESQVGSVSVNLREQELKRSFADRAIVPLVERMARLARKLGPFDEASINRKLAQAGNPAGLNAERFAAFKILGLVGGAGLGLLLSRAIDSSAGGTILILLFFAAIAFYAPDAILSHRSEERQGAIAKALPDTMDLLTISVEAGLGFDSALSQVTDRVPGPLSDEISRMLTEIRLGVPRVEAFRNLGDRTNVEELASFILAMIQAETYGVSISKVLRAQAKELRTKRRQNAEEQAMKVPVKILFPLVFCVLPALFVVVIGPGAIRIVENLVGTTP